MQCVCVLGGVDVVPLEHTMGKHIMGKPCVSKPLNFPDITDACAHSTPPNLQSLKGDAGLKAAAKGVDWKSVLASDPEFDGDLPSVEEFMKTVGL